MAWTPEHILLGVICALVLGIFITSIVGAVRSESCEPTEKHAAKAVAPVQQPVSTLMNPYAAGSAGMQPIRAAATTAGRA